MLLYTESNLGNFGFFISSSLVLSGKIKQRFVLFSVFFICFNISSNNFRVEFVCLSLSAVPKFMQNSPLQKLMYALHNDGKTISQASHTVCENIASDKNIDGIEWKAFKRLHNTVLIPNKWI